MNSLNDRKSAGNEKKDCVSGWLSQKIWACERSARNWSQNCWIMIKSVKCLPSEPDLFRRIIISDETWIFEFDPETKLQCSQWNPKKARKSKLCWSNSLMGKASSKVSSCHWTRRSINQFTRWLLVYALFKAREETKVVEGKIIDALPWQCTCL